MWSYLGDISNLDNCSHIFNTNDYWVAFGLESNRLYPGKCQPKWQISPVLAIGSYPSGSFHLVFKCYLEVAGSAGIFAIRFRNSIVNSTILQLSCGPMEKDETPWMAPWICNVRSCIGHSPKGISDDLAGMSWISSNQAWCAIKTDLKHSASMMQPCLVGGFTPSENY